MLFKFQFLVAQLINRTVEHLDDMIALGDLGLL